MHIHRDTRQGRLDFVTLHLLMHATAPWIPSCWCQARCVLTALAAGIPYAQKNVRMSTYPANKGEHWQCHICRPGYASQTPKRGPVCLSKSVGHSMLCCNVFVAAVGRMPALEVEPTAMFVLLCLFCWIFWIVSICSTHHPVRRQTSLRWFPPSVCDLAIICFA